MRERERKRERERENIIFLSWFVPYLFHLLVINPVRHCYNITRCRAGTKYFDSAHKLIIRAIIEFMLKIDQGNVTFNL